MDRTKFDITDFEFTYYVVGPSPYIVTEGDHNNFHTNPAIENGEFMWFTFSHEEEAHCFMATNPSDDEKAVSGPIQLNDHPPQEYGVAYTLRARRLNEKV